MIIIVTICVNYGFVINEQNCLIVIDKALFISPRVKKQFILGIMKMAKRKLLTSRIIALTKPMKASKKKLK